MKVKLEIGSTFMLYNVKYMPTSKKRLTSVGKAYFDGINVEIMGIDCNITDSEGHTLGRAEHIYPYQWLNDMSIREKKVSFANDTKYMESCLTHVDTRNVDL